MLTNIYAVQDLNPKNIGFNEDPTTGRIEIKVLDMGLGRTFDKNSKKKLTSDVGRLAYQPLEVIYPMLNEDYDEKRKTRFKKSLSKQITGDSWSVGVTLVELLTRQPIFYKLGEKLNDVQLGASMSKALGPPPVELAKRFACRL